MLINVTERAKLRVEAENMLGMPVLQSQANSDSKPFAMRGSGLRIDVGVLGAAFFGPNFLGSFC